MVALPRERSPGHHEGVRPPGSRQKEIVRGFMRNKIPLTALALLCGHFSPAAALRINEFGYLETQGLSVLVYQNQFHQIFRDQKLGGIEVILHGERIATDGEVRLLP